MSLVLWIMSNSHQTRESQHVLPYSSCNGLQLPDSVFDKHFSFWKRAAENWNKNDKILMLRGNAHYLFDLRCFTWLYGKCIKENLYFLGNLIYYIAYWLDSGIKVHFKLDPQESVLSVLLKMLMMCKILIQKLSELCCLMYFSRNSTKQFNCWFMHWNKQKLSLLFFITCYFFTLWVLKIMLFYWHFSYGYCDLS